MLKQNGNNDDDDNNKLRSSFEAADGLLSDDALESCSGLSILPLPSRSTLNISDHY